jgi:hypothetical protein
MNQEFHNVDPYPAPRDERVRRHNRIIAEFVGLPAVENMIQDDSINSKQFDTVMTNIYAAYAIETLTAN